jgi:hypothetical protein
MSPILEGIAMSMVVAYIELQCVCVGAKSALNANHTASRTKLASHAQKQVTCQSIFPEN